MPWFDFVVQGGRAVLVPIYNGTCERVNEAWTLGTNERRNLVIQWAREMRRAIDYLETRDDIDAEKLAFYGLGLGARFGPIFMALEERFRAAVFVAGGLNQYASYPSVLPTTPETDPFNFAPRVTAPVLMVNGRNDFARPVEVSQLPLLGLRGHVTRTSSIACPTAAMCLRCSTSSGKPSIFSISIWGRSSSQRSAPCPYGWKRPVLETTAHSGSAGRTTAMPSYSKRAVSVKSDWMPSSVAAGKFSVG